MIEGSNNHGSIFIKDWSTVVQRIHRGLENVNHREPATQWLCVAPFNNDDNWPFLLCSLKSKRKPLPTIPALYHNHRYYQHHLHWGVKRKTCPAISALHFRTPKLAEGKWKLVVEGIFLTFSYFQVFISSWSKKVKIRISFYLMLKPAICFFPHYIMGWWRPSVSEENSQKPCQQAVDMSWIAFWCFYVFSLKRSNIFSSTNFPN